MSVTATEIQDFSRFAHQRIGNGGAESMQQLLREWLAARETAEVVQAVHEGEAELAAGGGQSAADAFDEIRNKLGWS